MSKNYRNLESVNDFRDPQEYIYNSDLVEFTQFGVVLKDLVDASIVTAATFTNNTNFNYSNIEDLFTTPFTYGSVSIQNEKLGLIGGVFNKSWTTMLATNKKLGKEIPEGQIYFTYFPNYSNAPQTTQHIFSFGIPLEIEGKKNLLEILHSSTGDFVLRVYDKAGNLTEVEYEYVIEYANKPIQFAIAYDVTYSYEGSESAVRFAVFMNGELLHFFDLDGESFLIDKVKGFKFGNDTGRAFPNFSIKNFALLNKNPLLSVHQYAVKEDGLYELPETRFTTAPQKVEPLFCVTLEGLNNIVTSTNDSLAADKGFYVNYTFKLKNTEFYFDRTDLTWKEHKNPEDISDLGYMLAYKDQLPLSQGVEFKCIPYLRTIKGDRTPQITSQVIYYDQFVKCKESVPTALVYGYVRDALGNYVRNAKVVIIPSRSVVAEVGNFILPKLSKTVRTSSNGYWDAELALSTNFHPELLYNIQIIIRDEIVFQRANIRVTREGTIKLEDLLTDMNPDTPDTPIIPDDPDTPLPDNYIKGMFWTEIPDEEPDVPKASNSEV